MSRRDARAATDGSLTTYDPRGSCAEILYTSSSVKLSTADFHIVAVPTPINEAKQPDLTLLLRASETVGRNLKPGDIIEVSGERKTAAIVWRCRPEDANLGVIRVDGIIRKNAGVSLGDRVDIKKVETL